MYVPMPTMYLMVGLPGSGKTTISKLLAEKTGAVHLQSDEIRKGLFLVPTYSGRESGYVFAAMRAQAMAFGLDGRDVIIDSTNLSEKNRKSFYEMCAEEADEVHPFQCLMVIAVATDYEICLDRLAVKDADNLSDADSEVFDRMARQSQSDKISVPFITVFGEMLPIASVNKIMKERETWRKFTGPKVL